ncbi:hypothetical protein IWX47DRAFT_671409 [Phyllosticta citricarpa]
MMDSECCMLTILTPRCLWASTVYSLQSSLSMATVQTIIMHITFRSVSSRLLSSVPSFLHSLTGAHPDAMYACMHLEKSSMSISFHASRSPFHSSPLHPLDKRMEA